MQVAGGSSDHGNSKIAGLVIDNFGCPAVNTQVLLLPDNFNAAADSIAKLGFKTCTDSCGRYSFENVPFGIYCLSGGSLGGMSFVKKALAVESDTLNISTQCLKIPGSLYIEVDSIGLKDGVFIYFPGLPIFQKIDKTNLQQISSVPSGTVALMAYDSEHDTSIYLGIEYMKLEIIPGGSLLVPSCSPMPYCIVNSQPATELHGSIDSVYQFCAINPQVFQMVNCSYRFSWGDGTISEWNYNYRQNFSWHKAGIYYVQSQIMIANRYLAWSEPIAVIID